MKAIRIKPNEMPEVIELEHSLESLQAEVGGYIEVVNLHLCDMYLNEEGIAKRLPPNPTADSYARARLAREGRILLGNKILGTAILLGPCNEEGDPTDIPNDLLDRVLNHVPNLMETK